MRNLEILTKFDGLLEGCEGKLMSACLDEYGHQIFAYTESHKILCFKYDPERPSSLTLQHSCSLDLDVDDDEDGVFIVGMEYV